MSTVEEPEVRTWNFPRGTASVAVMVEFAADHGVTAARMLAGTGLTAQQLIDPEAQIPAETELTVVRNLLRELPEAPALGVEVGRRYRISTFGIFGYACVTSPTLREAISLALRYYRLGFAFCTPIVETRPREVVTWIHHDTIPADVQQFLAERDIIAMHRVMSDLLGSRVDFTRAEFAYPATDQAELLESLFGVRPAFDRPHTVFGIDPDLLAQPLPQANQPTWAVCVAQCRDLLHRRSARTGIAAEVRDRLLPGTAATGFATPPSFEAVARDLNLSPRTLRRHLDAAGTSYRALLDEVRHTLAEEMLTATPLSVDDIAIRLGYAEATPFIHAFKRWTSTTPAAYRRTHRRD
ncbi:AraC family transcriptional regulator [Nocardia sp. 2]|uniref:AraC family transcriptional regulator n=1 Tax=Nocardia acididurans TaxID=2802282 RepID=A0ABS1MD44_9NOCA|nr:AraC family transcriptional regulator [Nocardia acididurans]MBL1078184.1 AraC family transcriptional regulator [Nocardia acididurans]